MATKNFAFYHFVIVLLFLCAAFANPDSSSKNQQDSATDIRRLRLTNADVAALRLSKYLKLFSSKRNNFAEDDKRKFSEEAPWYLGKRSIPVHSEEAPWYLGKRSQPLHAEESPWYLGKRSTPNNEWFLGKRNVQLHSEEAPWYLGKRDITKYQGRERVDADDRYQPVNDNEDAGVKRWRLLMHQLW